MQLVLNTYGGFIRKRGECFEIGVQNENKELDKKEISARKVDSILITTAVLISTDAILLAYENNIDIVFLDKYGKPYSRVWHSKFGSTTYIRRKQLEFSEDVKGLKLARDWIVQKVENQKELLERLKKKREDKKEKIEEYIASLSAYKEKLTLLNGNHIADVREKIFSLEALCGKVYWEALNFIMPEKYKFPGRSRRPAKDEFNAFLNYGYGILYSKMERACILAGLDPYIGFLHTDNYGKRSLVFDLIELFRIHADEVVVSLFSRRMVKKNMVREIQNGMTLEKPGKELLISEFNKAMEQTMHYRGRNIKKSNIMEYECHRIANSFIGKEDMNIDISGYDAPITDADISVSEGEE